MNNQNQNWAWHLDVLASSPSTNAELKSRLKSEQASIGSALLTRCQTNGRGRLERSWISPPGNIALSAVVPGEAKAYQLSLLAGLSLQRTLAQKIGLKCQIKWPNDLLIKKRKLAGILCEAVPDKQAVVVGFGINYESLNMDFPEELRPMIATVSEFTKLKLSAKDFAMALLDSFQADWLRYNTLGLEALLPEILENFAFLGQNVTVTEASEPPYAARVKGLTPEGFLIIEMANGSVRQLVAGDVRGES